MVLGQGRVVARVRALQTNHAGALPTVVILDEPLLERYRVGLAKVDRFRGEHWLLECALVELAIHRARRRWLDLVESRKVDLVGALVANCMQWV